MKININEGNADIIRFMNFRAELIEHEGGEPIYRVLTDTHLFLERFRVNDIARISGFIDEDHIPYFYKLLKNRLAYHKSWDWLMPVVEKIESIELSNKEYPNFSVKIIKNTCEVMRCRNSEVYKTISHKFENSKINNTYQAVVEFIQWYNLQEKIKK